MQRTKGFSLVEVTLAIGVIAFALLAIFALIPVGMNSGRAAIDATRTSLIAEDVQNRVQSSVTDATFAAGGDLPLPTLYYDREGTFLVTGYSDALYRVTTIVHGRWTVNIPPNVDANHLRPVTVQIGWPVNTADGTVVGNNAARNTFSFYVRKP